MRQLSKLPVLCKLGDAKAFLKTQALRLAATGVRCSTKLKDVNGNFFVTWSRKRKKKPVCVFSLTSVLKQTQREGMLHRMLWAETISRLNGENLAATTRITDLFIKMFWLCCEMFWLCCVMVEIYRQKTTRRHKGSNSNKISVPNAVHRPHRATGNRKH